MSIKAVNKNSIEIEEHCISCNDNKHYNLPGRTPRLGSLSCLHVMFIVYADACRHMCACHGLWPEHASGHHNGNMSHIIITQCHQPSLTSPGSWKQLTRTPAHDTGTGLEPAWREGLYLTVHMYSERCTVTCVQGVRYE